MASYLVLYPGKLMHDHFREARDGIVAVRTRLRSDRECREAVFAELKQITDPDILVALTKLLAPAMQNETAFRAWISERVRAERASDRLLGELAFDVLANVCRPVEFVLLEAVLTRS